MPSLDALLFKDAALNQAFGYALKSELETPLITYTGSSWHSVGRSFRQSGSKISCIVALFKRIVHALRLIFSVNYAERFYHIRHLFAVVYKEHNEVRKLEIPAKKEEPPPIEEKPATPKVDIPKEIPQPVLTTMTVAQKNFVWISEYKKGDEIDIKEGLFIKPEKTPNYTDDLQKKIVSLVKETYASSLKEQKVFLGRWKFVKGITYLRKNWTIFNSILREGLSELLPQSEQHLKQEAILSYKFGRGYLFEKDYRDKEERLIITYSQTVTLTESDQNKLARACIDQLHANLDEAVRGRLFKVFNQLLLYANLHSYHTLRSKLLELLNNFGKLDPKNALADAQRNPVSELGNRLRLILKFKPAEIFTETEQQQLMQKIKAHYQEYVKLYDHFSMSRSLLLDIGHELCQGLKQMAKKYQDISLANSLRTTYQELETFLLKKEEELEDELKSVIDNANANPFDLLGIGQLHYKLEDVEKTLTQTYNQVMAQQAIKFISPKEKFITRD